MRYSIRSQVISAAFLLAASTLSVAALSSASDVVLRLPSLGEGCPVGVAVERRSPVEVANIGNAPRHQHSQRIRLSLRPLETPGIERVDLLVNAFSTRPRRLDTGAGTSSDSSLDIDRTFQISASGSSALHQRDLWVDRVGGVTSVELTSITYVDGTTWHASPKSTCRAVPSNALLIGSN